MAFDKKGFDKTGGTSNNNCLNFWGYYTTEDTVAQTQAAGYFSDAVKSGFKNDDLIRIKASDGAYLGCFSAPVDDVILCNELPF